MICKYCNKERETREMGVTTFRGFPGEKEFICSKCIGQALIENIKGTITKQKRKTIKKVCKECGGNFYADRNARLYCSRKCAGKANRKKQLTK